jgi:hypothetical protein
LRPPMHPGCTCTQLLFHRITKQLCVNFMPSGTQSEISISYIVSNGLQSLCTSISSFYEAFLVLRKFYGIIDPTPPSSRALAANTSCDWPEMSLLNGLLVSLRNNIKAAAGCQDALTSLDIAMHSHQTSLVSLYSPKSNLVARTSKSFLYLASPSMLALL